MRRLSSAVIVVGVVLLALSGGPVAADQPDPGSGVQTDGDAGSFGDDQETNMDPIGEFCTAVKGGSVVCVD